MKQSKHARQLSGMVLTAIVLSANAALTEPLPIVEVASPNINCLASPQCRIAVVDTVGALGDGPSGEWGSLQSRSAQADASARAAGNSMMLYRLDLRQATARTGTACIAEITLKSAPPAQTLDLDADGTEERGVFVVTRGAIGSVRPTRADYHEGEMTITFGEGVCPPIGQRGGQSSFFFGWFAPGEPDSQTARVVLADGENFLVEARAPSSEFGRIRHQVDPELAEQRVTVPGFLPGQIREIEVLRAQDGRYHSLVADEVVLSTDDPAVLEEFLERYDAHVLRSFDPRDFGADDGPIAYHIGLDVEAANIDAATFAEDLVALGYERGGTFEISSERALRLLALIAAESRRGLEIDGEWLMRLRQFRGFSATEAKNFPPPTPPGVSPRPRGPVPNSFVYSRNAYTWPTLSSGSTQDIGVGDAWTMLGRVGRLRPTLTLGVIDIGFGFTVDQPWATVDTLDNIDPLQTTFRAGSIPFDFCNITPPSTVCNHGASVASTFAGIPDNRVGTAGPAGPVARMIVYIGAILNTRTSLLGGLQIAHENGVDVLNMSFGREGWEPWAWNAGYSAGISRFTRGLKRGGMTLVAAAGNDGDEETRGLLGDFDGPCQNDGVLCVGGVGFDSLVRHPRSDFGEGVDIYGPYINFGGPLPPSPDPTTISIFAGTSGASPFVAGVAALVRAADPTLSADEVDAILLRTAKRAPDPSDPRLVNRIVDAHEAVAAALIGSAIEPLTAEIIGPADGERISAGRVSRSLVADVFSLFDIAPSVTWQSDVEGDLGSGSFASHVFRTPGLQTITMTAADSRGNRVVDTVSVTIANDPPVVIIDTPRTGQSFQRSEIITLRGRARDLNRPLDGIDPSELRWSLGGGETLGSGPVVRLERNRLPVGTHTLRLTVRKDGLEGRDEVAINVLPSAADTPPTARIESPDNGFSEYANRRDPSGRWFLDLELRGTGQDPEDGTLDGASLRWFATGPNGLRRQIGTGRSISAALESLQSFSTTYIIELEAMDSAGTSRSDRIRVTVQILS